VSRTPPTPIRVLLVEDHPIARLGLAGVIAGCPDLELVGEATTGAEALRGVVRHEPDVCLLDLGLPDRDGLEVLAEMVRARPAPAMGIVIVSSSDSSDSVRRALASGARSYVFKTASPETIVDTILRVQAARGRAVDLPSEVASRLREEVSLSPREREVLRSITQGATNPEIAAALGISETTVRTHVVHILNKLGARDRTEATSIAFRRRLV
jgi:DNA-binding NarL/FixJ family response regulator